MPKRKIVGLSERLSGIPSLISNNLAKTVTQQGIIDAIQKVRIKAQQEALKNYNADDFQPVIVAKPDATYVAPIEKPVKGSTQTHGKYIGSQSKFTNELYDSYYKAVRPGATSDEDADRQARFLTQKAAFETGYGLHLANTHNYGGHRKNGKWLSFNSIDDFTKRDVALLDKKWSGWRNSKSEKDFVKSITTNSGYGHYAPENEYQGYYGLNKRVNNYINMGRRKLSCGGKVSRPKAFWGALISSVIGAGASILGSQMQKDTQEEIMEENKRRENEKYYKDMARNMGNLLNSRDAQEAYENQFRTVYEKGGRRRLRNTVGITDGGMFINSSTGRLYCPGDKLPVGTYDVLNYTHDEINPSGNTGNGMKAGNKKFEVEKNERVTIRPNSVLVLSDSIKIPTPYGIDTPANASRNGVDNTYVERIQQAMNGNYNGTNIRHKLKQMSGLIPRKQYASIMAFRNGGSISRPVERIKAEDGIVIRNGRKYKQMTYPGTIKTYLQDIGPADEVTMSSTSNVNTMTSFAKSGIRGNNNQYQTWKGRDGKMYYGTITPGKNGNTYNIVSTLGGNNEGGIRGINKQSNNVVGSGTNKGNMFINYTIDSGQPTDEIVVTGRRPATDGRRTISSAGKVSKISPFSAPDFSRDIESILKEQNPKDSPSILYKGAYPQDNITEDNLEIFGFNNPNADVNGPISLGNVNIVSEKVPSNFDWSNLAGGIINGVGGLVSGLITNSALDKTYTPREPAPTMAVKLPTTYSIGADLAENNRLTGRMLGDARRNTSSSAGLLSRRNLINLTSGDRANSLYQTKSRAEGEMLTRDALNQQQVNMFNAQRRDAYEQAKAQLEANRNIYKAYNWGNTIDKIVGAYNDYDAQVRQNKADDVAMNWYLSTLPDKDRNWFINQMRGGKNRVTFRR